MDNNSRFKYILFLTKNYVLFFLTICFIVTCSFLLFLNGIDVGLENLRDNALITLGNIMLLSLLFTIIDVIQRRITIKKPVDKIVVATEELASGNFSNRIESDSGFYNRKEFNLIAENLNKMSKELEGIETLRTDFITNVSHELKTPLSVIQNYASLLKMKDLSEESRLEYATTISDSSLKLSELVSNILKLNKLENQQIYPEKTTFNLAEQLRECILSFENFWEEKNLVIETDLEEVSIVEDMELVSVIWNNLISNAIKFTPENGKIRISLTAHNSTVSVRIADNGEGMSSEVGKHMFDKFYQGDSSRISHGNGLGLALVKRVIDIVNGEISVESEIGRGSVFTVKLWRNENESHS